MPKERPPTIDADYELVRGPWPRWMWRMGLFTLVVRTGLAVLACILIGLAMLMMFWR